MDKHNRQQIKQAMERSFEAWNEARTLFSRFDYPMEWYHTMVRNLQLFLDIYTKFANQLRDCKRNSENPNWGLPEVPPPPDHNKYPDVDTESLHISAILNGNPKFKSPYEEENNPNKKEDKE